MGLYSDMIVMCASYRVEWSLIWRSYFTICYATCMKKGHIDIYCLNIYVEANPEVMHSRMAKIN